MRALLVNDFFEEVDLEEQVIHIVGDFEENNDLQYIAGITLNYYDSELGYISNLNWNSGSRLNQIESIQFVRFNEMLLGGRMIDPDVGNVYLLACDDSNTAFVQPFDEIIPTGEVTVMKMVDDRYFVHSGLYSQTIMESEDDGLVPITGVLRHVFVADMVPFPADHLGAVPISNTTAVARAVMPAGVSFDFKRHIWVGGENQFQLIGSDEGLSLIYLDITNNQVTVETSGIDFQFLGGIGDIYSLEIVNEPPLGTSSSSSSSLSSQSSISTSSSSQSTSSSSQSDSSSSNSSSSTSSSSSSTSSSSDFSFPDIISAGGLPVETLVVAGRFDTVGGQPRAGVAFIDSNMKTLLDFELITSINGPIYVAAYDPETEYLWLGGLFSTVTDINNITHSVNNLIVFNLSHPNALRVPLDVNTNGVVKDIKFWSKKAIIGGNFNTVTNSNIPRLGVAAFNRNTGELY